MDRLTLFLFITLAVAIVGIILAVIFIPGKDADETEPPHVAPRPGKVTPRGWATQSFSPSCLFGMSPTIYFACGKCCAEQQLKIPMHTVPDEDIGLPLRCQRCGTVNRLPIKRK